MIQALTNECINTLKFTLKSVRVWAFYASREVGKHPQTPRLSKLHCPVPRNPPGVSGMCSRVLIYPVEKSTNRDEIMMLCNQRAGQSFQKVQIFFRLFFAWIELHRNTLLPITPPPSAVHAFVSVTLFWEKAAVSQSIKRHIHKHCSLKSITNTRSEIPLYGIYKKVWNMEYIIYIYGIYGIYKK